MNLTKRALRLVSSDGEAVEVAPDARHVGLVSMGELVQVEDGAGRRFPLSVRRATGVKGLPDPEPGALYVVPAEVAMALAGRRDDIAFVADEARHPLPSGGTTTVSVLRRVVPVFQTAPS